MGGEESLFEMRELEVGYGSKTAVEGLSLRLITGGALGLLGPNGAGKTSTVRALLGMLVPRRGTVSLFGKPPGSPLSFSQLGFAPEDGVPPEYLTGHEYLSFVSEMRVADRKSRGQEVASLLEWFELAPEKRIRDYSKGMRRRLILAQAFIGNPRFLVLDEPLNGLDPLLIIKLREKLEAYRQAGGSILYSSHLLAEVEKTCTEVAILTSGKLVCFEKVSTLVQEFGSVEAAFAKKVGRN